MESVESLEQAARFVEKQLVESTRYERPARLDWRIGCIGAGFIMADCHLVSYRNAGFNPVAIASRTSAHAKAVAERHAIPAVYVSWRELLEDSSIEILDVAFPPDQQLEIVRAACKKANIPRHSLPKAHRDVARQRARNHAPSAKRAAKRLP